MVPPKDRRTVRPAACQRSPVAARLDRPLPEKPDVHVLLGPGKGRDRIGCLMKIPFRRERRRSGRSGLDLPVTFRIYLPSCPEIASSFLSARLYDVSQQGLALLTDAIHSHSLHMFHPTATSAEQCLLEIRIPTGDEGLTLHGRVVWYDRIDTEGPYLFQVGIEVLDHPKDLRKQIETSVREQPSASQPMEM